MKQKTETVRRGLWIAVMAALGVGTGVFAQDVQYEDNDGKEKAHPANVSEALKDSLTVMLQQEGKADLAVDYVNQVLEQDTTDFGKAEIAYAAATVLGAGGAYQEAAAFCRKALAYQDNLGKAYILLARLYATHPYWTDERALNQCTYFLVIDKLQRAKQMDVTVVKEANELLAMYAQEIPNPKDLFMLGYKVGDRVNIGGWIGESTTIR